MDLKMTGAGLQNQANVTQTMKQRMNYLVARQGIVAGNVANASTPGYISQDLSFAGTLQKAGINLDKTHAYHIEGKDNTTRSLGKVTQDKTHMREDGNSVKLDEEMLKLNDIQMNYRLMTRLYSKHAGMHKLALQGSR
jgi:flagellar basal-body rod protein FlgB